MKKINQYKLLAGICALSLFTACDFEELNTNPFEMTDEMGIRDGVAVGGAVMAMQRAVITVGTQADDTEAINQYQVAYNLSADSWSGFFGQNNNWYSGSNNTTYYLQDNWVAATYTNSYTTLLSSWKKIKQESEKNETPEIFALAQILKYLLGTKRLVFRSHSLHPCRRTCTGDTFRQRASCIQCHVCRSDGRYRSLDSESGTRGNYCCRL